jgi:hypothetical protein
MSSVVLNEVAISEEQGGPNWDELIQHIFDDPRFHKTHGSSRRWQVAVNGVRAGIIVAWRPDEYPNYALNKADLDRLLELKRSGSFNAAFIVIATITGEFERHYVGHRGAEVLAGELKSARLRKGPHGEFWLLQDGVSPLEIQYDDIPW